MCQLALSVLASGEFKTKAWQNILGYLVCAQNKLDTNSFHRLSQSFYGRLKIICTDTILEIWQRKNLLGVWHNNWKYGQEKISIIGRNILSWGRRDGKARKNRQGREQVLLPFSIFVFVTYSYLYIWCICVFVDIHVHICTSDAFSVFVNIHIHICTSNPFLYL